MSLGRLSAARDHIKLGHSHNYYVILLLIIFVTSVYGSENKCFGYNFLIFQAKVFKYLFLYSGVQFSWVHGQSLPFCGLIFVDTPIMYYTAELTLCHGFNFTVR